MSVTLSGNAVKINGQFPQVGQKVKDFTLTKADLSECSLKEFEGKKKILNIVPSLDTAVCQVSAKKFNEKVANLDNVELIVISSDLPFAMKRFCSAESLDNVVTLSTFRNDEFKINYGVDIADGPLQGLATRAVIVLDENNNVIFSELVKEIKDEPNYDEALNSIK